MVKNYRDRIDEMFEEYVPCEGAAKTKGGELVRAISRIGYRFLNDGDQIGVGYGKETCNPAARYVMKVFPDTDMSGLISAMWGNVNERLYEMGLDALIEETVRYLENNAELFKTENTDNYMNYRTEEDEDWDDEEEDW